MPIRRIKKNYKRAPKKTVPASTKKYVKRVVGGNIETKHISAVSGVISVSDTPAVYTTIYPTFGIGGDQRIGDKIKMASFNFKYSMYLSDPSNLMRVILFQWCNNSVISGTPTAAQVLQSATTYSWLSQINQDSRQNIKILYDRTHTMNDSDQKQITRSVNINKFRVRNLEFASTAAQNCLHKGEIYLLLVSDSAAIVHPTFVWRFMLKYKDA